MNNPSSFNTIRVFSPKNKNTWFSIIPDYGGCLNEFVVNGQEILMSATTPAAFEKHTMKSYAGAQLFPYPNRIKEATYTFNKKHYVLPKNDPPRNHSLHGLIYNHAFKVDKIDTELGMVTLSFEYHQNHPGYPFNARIKNNFQLKNNTLYISTTIENIGEKEFPFGHGWHPYFITDAGANLWNLQIPKAIYYPIHEDLIPTGNSKVSNDFLRLQKIGSKALNHCYQFIETTKEPSIILSATDKKIEICLTLKGYPFIQIYTPPDRSSIALEPQTCAPDAFNNHIGLLYLKPTQYMKFQFNIKVNLNHNTKIIL